MSAGYSYTTLSAGPGEPVRVGVSFCLDEQAWIVVCGIEAGRPHLTVEHGDVSVRFAPRSDTVITAEDARIARKLADQAASYAAEVERLSGTGNPDGSGAAAA
jgi:hypothetical protein